MVDPNRIKSNSQPPHIIIERINQKDRIIEPPFSRDKQNLTFPPGKNEFHIEYTGLNVPIPERILFKTKLEGYDKEWQNMGTRRTAYYTNLPPGDFTFRVIACINDGVWNKTGASVSFYLKPFFSPNPVVLWPMPLAVHGPGVPWLPFSGPSIEKTVTATQRPGQRVYP